MTSSLFLVLFLVLILVIAIVIAIVIESVERSRTRTTTSRSLLDIAWFTNRFGGKLAGRGGR